MQSSPTDNDSDLGESNTNRLDEWNRLVGGVMSNSDMMGPGETILKVDAKALLKEMLGRCLPRSAERRRPGRMQHTSGQLQRGPSDIDAANTGMKEPGWNQHCEDL